MTTAHQNTAVTRPKPILKTGRPPLVTPEIVERVAARIVSGVPLRYALALETPVIPVAHWHKSIEGSPKLSAIYDKKIGEGIDAMLQKVAAAECLRKLPPEVWILERRFKEFFGQQRELANLTVNQTVIGISEEVRRRAAELLARKTTKVLPQSATVGGSKPVLPGCQDSGPPSTDRL